MKVVDVAFTGYPVVNIERARGFYEDTLGLKPKVFDLPEEKYWVEYDLPNGTLAITDVDPNWKPQNNGAAIALEVDDFEKTMGQLKEKGVTIVQDLIDTPVCRIGTILDTEGNAVTIHCQKDCHPDKIGQSNG